jgi:sec-independent protein translocase protein TatB
MLPSLGFNEIIILGILALLVVGPKDLPLLFRKIGRWTAKLRGMAQEFRTGFDELARQAELDELKREVDALRKTTSLQDIRNELSKPLPTLEDYAGVSKPAPSLPSPEGPASTETAVPPPIATARGPSGPSITQTSDTDAAPAEAPAAEEAPSNVTPIVRSAP